MTKTEQETRVELRKVLSAPPQKVWDAWTDASSMSAWMCPGPVQRAEATLDVRKGGSYRLDMIAGDQRMEHTGEYVTVDPPRKLVMTWQSSAAGPEETLLTIEILPHARGSELVLTHERFVDALG